VDAYREIVTGLPTTLLLAVLSLAIGAVGAVPLMVARRSSALALRLPARAAIDLLRAIPPIVWLFLVFFGLSEANVQLQPFTAAVVALGVVSCAYLAEIYRGGFMAIDHGQVEAGMALGLRRRDALRFVLAPQALRVALPSMATYAIALLKDTSLAYTIGVHEVLFHATEEAQLGAASPLGILLFAGGLYALLSIPTGLLARRLDASMRSKVAR
jgi:His/Glu/Gln/Arg/opine family amino acid ABC transporter permease subunit